MNLSAHFATMTAVADVGRLLLGALDLLECLDVHQVQHNDLWSPREREGIPHAPPACDFSKALFSHIFLSSSLPVCFSFCLIWSISLPYVFAVFLRLRSCLSHIRIIANAACPQIWGVSGSLVDTSVWIVPTCIHRLLLNRRGIKVSLVSHEGRVCR